MKRPRGFSRRSFFRLLAAGGTAFALEPFLSACGEEKTTAPFHPTEQAPTPFLADTPTDQPVHEVPGLVTSTTQPPVEIAEQPTEPTQPIQVASNVDLVVLHTDVANEKQNSLEAVRRLLAPLGGIERFVSAGQSVVIKPNICTAYYGYEYAATTNPYLVGALVTLCLGAGARRVQVMDSPFGGTAQKAYMVSGIQEQVESAGGEMVLMAPLKFVATDIPQGLDITRWNIFDQVLKADVLINVPILKHHNLARLTIGMKNLMGVIDNRPAIHRNMGQRLADLASVVKPDLTIVDAMRMLMANGPTGGSLSDVREAGTLIASTDLVAADSYAAQFFGIPPDNLGYITAGTAMGLGRSDLDNLKIEEFNL